jgi:hypothetical protein
MGDGIGVFGFWLAIGFAALGLSFGPVGRGLGRWIESRTAGGRGEPDENTAMRLAEIDALTHRLAELEERLDFTERLLAQHREPTRLGG